MQREEAKKFTPDEDQVWKRLFTGLHKSRQTQAHPIFAEGVEGLQIPSERVPDLGPINARLKSKTGWQGVWVHGLEDAGSFFEGLSERLFPIGNFIREPHDLSYTPAPDVFHDLYGHLPFFWDTDFAEFCHEFGCRAIRYLDQPAALRQFERLFWFAVEFPIVETPNGRRIFGGGILSSSRECDYALSTEPQVLPFDCDTIRNRDYDISKLQDTIFVLESPDQLYGCLSEFEQGVFQTLTNSGLQSDQAKISQNP